VLARWSGGKGFHLVDAGLGTLSGELGNPALRRQYRA
jgi:hypothetical protein